MKIFIKFILCNNSRFILMLGKVCRDASMLSTPTARYTLFRSMTATPAYY